MYFDEAVTPIEDRGSSSFEGTSHLRSQLPQLFKKYNITTLFDAGANDAAWQASTIGQMVKYSAGDHNPLMVESAKLRDPDLDIIVHNVTIDPLPPVDVLFLRDVAIHFNNINKKLMLQNWLRSGIPWILMTHLDYTKENTDFIFDKNIFPESGVNWYLTPWNFPKSTDFVTEMNPYSDRYMMLWHKDQICLS